MKYTENGSTVTAVANENFHFVKWSDGLESASRNETNVQESLSFQAIFEADTPVIPESFTLTFDTDGGSANPEALTGKGDKNLAGEPTKDGYTFGGWIIGGETLPAGSVYKLLANGSAKAKWILKVTPPSNGGGNDSPPPTIIERIIERVVQAVVAPLALPEPVVEVLIYAEPIDPNVVLVDMTDYVGESKPEAAAPAPLVLPTTKGSSLATSKVGTLKTAVYFDMNGTKLDSNDKKILRDAVAKVKSQLTAASKITLNVVGWVQPTKVSPNVMGLSVGRAKAALDYVKSLGIKATMKVTAPGEAKVNVSKNRMATVDFKWTDSK